MKFIKRSGIEETLTKKKISDSIQKANENVLDDDKLSKKQIQRITEAVYNACIELDRPVSVDEVEDFVEKQIMANSGYEVAKCYIRYRYEKERVRQNKYLTEKLMATNVVNQNANLDEFSFGGRIGEAASFILKEYALQNLVSKKARENHNNNEIYIHDLSHYAVGDHNCLSIPFDKLLKEGFNTRQVDIRPAQSINTAMQLVAVIFQLQSLQQFGGVAATHLDWTMVPYVRLSFHKHYFDGLRFIDLSSGSQLRKNFGSKTPLTKDEIRELSIDSDWYNHTLPAYEYAMEKTIEELNQAVEGMYHNLNSLQSRSGNQLPFTSINYGTCTLPEGRMVIKALLDGSIKGVGKFHRTSIFPCGIFQVGKGINLYKGDPNYDLFLLALKSTSQRLYPNYCNIDWTGNEGYDKNDPETYSSTMGCRTWSAWDINGLGFKKDGRGNICPVTIIMPTLAMEADRDVEKFMKLLDKKINEAKDMLLERFDWICSQPAKSANFMYENGTMSGYVPEEGIRSALKHGSLAIGQIGLAETLQLLIGTDHTTEKGMELAQRIEQLFSDKCNKFKKELKLNFGVYYSPAENLCYTSMKKFQEKYGVIEKVSDKEFWTNSMHVPVWHKLNPFQKIDIESKLTGYSRAGCITYVEVTGDIKNNIEALEKLVVYAMEKDIPYFAINVPSDTCMDDGYQGDIHECCPICGGTNIQRLKRVTGYISTDYHHFNNGKIQEVEKRVKHNGIIVS